MICDLDSLGICKRHGILHVGYLLHLCLLDTAEGERYRTALDKLLAPRRDSLRESNTPPPKQIPPQRQPPCRHLGQRIRLPVTNAVKQEWCETPCKRFVDVFECRAGCRGGEVTLVYCKTCPVNTNLTEGKS